MSFEIVCSRDGWGGTNYDLKTDLFRERIYRPKSTAPYIILDGERVNLLPDMRKALCAAIDRNRKEII